MIALASVAEETSGLSPEPLSWCSAALCRNANQEHCWHGNHAGFRRGDNEARSCVHGPRLPPYLFRVDVVAASTSALAAVVERLGLRRAALPVHVVPALGGRRAADRARTAYEGRRRA